MSDVFGIQAVRSMLSHNPERARALYILRGRRDARINEIIVLAKQAGIRHQSVEPAWLRKRLADEAHQGVLLECHELAMVREAQLYDHLDSLTSTPLLLVLDGITDPRNFGACLRSANAAGVDAVIVPKRNSAPLNGLALKTAQGGAEDLMIVEVTNLARTLKALMQRNIWVIGADGDAATAYTEVDAKASLAVVMGSEGKGLRRLTKELCDQLVHIPMQGHVSSLNVSVATGVMLFEVQRQRSL